MTKTTDFIAELIRGANLADRLTFGERRDLVERGLKTAAALRSLLHKTGNIISIDTGSGRELDRIAVAIRRGRENTSPRDMLAIAAEIRRLRIINKEHRDPG